jgi:hypothetical protein
MRCVHPLGTSRAMTEEAKSHLCAHGVEPEDDDEGLPC